MACLVHYTKMSVLKKNRDKRKLNIKNVKKHNVPLLNKMNLNKLDKTYTFNFSIKFEQTYFFMNIKLI